MNTRQLADVKVIEQAVLQEIAKNLPKFVKSVVRQKTIEAQNQELGIIVQNGIRRPDTNSPAYVVWKAFDLLQAKGVTPDPIIAKKLAQKLNQIEAVVILDLYLWRKFQGAIPTANHTRRHYD